MTNIRGREQWLRETGKDPSEYKIGWVNYLNHIVEVDRKIGAVCLRLDEEGNRYLELTPDEANMFAAKILQARKALVDDSD